jgi:hypothetical protein
VDAAGKILSGRALPSGASDLKNAYEIAANWRAAHGYPLYILVKTLHNRAHQVDREAIVVRRLKRMPAIISKLDRFPKMSLATMQDIGGCRAVVRTVRMVDKLVSLYKETSPSTFNVVGGSKNYVAEPKPDGYRSVHLVYQYCGKSQGEAFGGLRIELQLRSRLQHAWATAVEIVDTITGQGLKLGRGADSWRRFFALTGSLTALEEERPPVPNTPTCRNELAAELRDISPLVNFPSVLYALASGVEGIASVRDGALFYILVLDSERMVTHVKGFSAETEAIEEYGNFEQQALGKPHIQTVLVSADSVESLRTAYPNYYMDARVFVRFVQGMLIGRPQRNGLTEVPILEV